MHLPSIIYVFSLLKLCTSFSIAWARVTPEHEGDLLYVVLVYPPDYKGSLSLTHNLRILPPSILKIDLKKQINKQDFEFEIAICLD